MGVRRAGRHAAAAVFGQEREQGIHPRVVGAAGNRAAVARVVDEAGAAQRVQVMGQGGRRDVGAQLQLADAETFRSGLHQQPEHIEPVFLSERRKRGDNIRLFHISTNIEIISCVKTYFDKC